MPYPRGRAIDRVRDQVAHQLERLERAVAAEA
jgi:hypothetical protein